MSSYLKQLNPKVKEYFKILSPEFPEWLSDYIDTPQMQRLSGVSMVCGTDYSPIFHYPFFQHTLNHSIGVSLILWHFTKDKVQTLAGLFHDIASPSFKHCIDFMNGDAKTQESTEEKTESILKDSKEITDLLTRDNISVEDICDFAKYPLANNPTPRLSADRFEYTFSNGLFLYEAWDLPKIKEFYHNIVIVKNEDGLDEFGFQDSSLCEEYVHMALPIFSHYHSDNNRTVMQFFADIIKSMHVKGYLSAQDLYTFSESEMIEKILNCEDSYLQESFVKFQNATSVYGSDVEVKNKYCIHVNAKKRYTLPLTNWKNSVVRIDKISEQTKIDLENYFNQKLYPYTGFDFDFKPYE